MQPAMMKSAKPLHLQCICIVRVVGLGLGIAADLAWLRNEQALTARVGYPLMSLRHFGAGRTGKTPCLGMAGRAVPQLLS
jgi:hypothetical protein